MSSCYYKTEDGLCVVNDNMEAGDSGGSTVGSEFEIFNRAVVKFKEAWENYMRVIAE